MKKTMLTYRTLDKFENEFVTEFYTEEEIKKIEYCAYVANIGNEGTEEEIFKKFLRVLRIEKITYELKVIRKIRAEIRNRKHFSIRSAWGRGVTEYAAEFVDNLAEAIEEGYFDKGDLVDARKLEKFLLNGAENWKAYSWGGSSLIYDRNIAERLCNPSELKKTDNGNRRPNRNEEWLDVQARALYQAQNRVRIAVKEVINGVQ